MIKPEQSPKKDKKRTQEIVIVKPLTNMPICITNVPERDSRDTKENQSASPKKPPSKH